MKISVAVHGMRSWRAVLWGINLVEIVAWDWAWGRRNRGSRRIRNDGEDGEGCGAAGVGDLGPFTAATEGVASTGSMAKR